MHLPKANHCPGSVLFLFRVKGNVYLHTGDFRFDRSMLEYPALKQITIDRLYLGKQRSFPRCFRIRSSPLVSLVVNMALQDTTYCNRRYVFPPQVEAINFIVQKILNTIADPMKKRTLFFIGTYTIGKERILEELVKRSSEKIYVMEKKLSILKLCGLTPLLMSRYDLRRPVYRDYSLATPGW